MTSNIVATSQNIYNVSFLYLILSIYSTYSPSSNGDCLGGALDESIGLNPVEGATGVYLSSSIYLFIWFYLSIYSILSIYSPSSSGDCLGGALDESIGLNPGGGATGGGWLGGGPAPMGGYPWGGPMLGKPGGGPDNRYNFNLLVCIVIS